MSDCCLDYTTQMKLLIYQGYSLQERIRRAAEVLLQRLPSFLETYKKDFIDLAKMIENSDGVSHQEFHAKTRLLSRLRSHNFAEALDVTNLVDDMKLCLANQPHSKFLNR